MLFVRVITLCVFTTELGASMEGGGAELSRQRMFARSSSGSIRCADMPED